jgi:membrane AbrB-like protein
MNPSLSLVVYVLVGILGGLVGAKSKIPAGPMIGAMLAVVALKLAANKSWEIPASFGFVVQVLVGVTVAAVFHPDMMKTLSRVVVPLISSTLVLVFVGIVMSALFARLGLMDMSTAYLSTSPGAMSALVWLAIDNHSNPPVVISFHCFRIMFVILTAPLILKYFSG